MDERKIEMIAKKIDNAMIDIFAELQDEAGIMYGDIDPFMNMEYDEACKALAEMIYKIIEDQKIYNKEF